MIKEPALILIDEFGNTHIDLSKNGTFSHFIYTALIIPLKNKEEANKVRNHISKSAFFGKELKSNKLGPKMFERRLAALKELVTGLDFTIDVLVIDKSKLESADGLRYKQVFYKYFQNLFVSKYSQRYESFEIIADKVGEQFKFELQQYVRANGIQSDLFNPNRTFYLKDDYTEEPLLQLADLVCGSIGKIFCSSHTEPRAKELFSALHTRTSVDYFPSQLKVFLPAEKNQQVDEQVGNVTINLVIDFIENNPLRTQQEYLRLIDYLLLHYNIDRERVVPTYELLNYLEQFAPGTTEEKVRYMVRTLRYEGLFIVSHGGKSGYKLAANYHDIEQYFNHFLKYVIPMLQKVKILNESIAASTYNKINPLEKDDTFQQLKELLSAL